MEAGETIKAMSEFLDTHYKEELLKRVAEGKEFLALSFSQLAEFDPALAQELLDNPEETIKAAELAISQMELARRVKRFRVRIIELPEGTGKGVEMMIRDIRSKHLKKLMMIRGLVRRKTDVRPEVTSTRFECPSCGSITAILQLETVFREPMRCSCGRKGHFKLVSKELVDAQKIVLEEAPEDLEGGEQPKRMDIILKDDLVSPLSDRRTNPGSKIIVVGVLKDYPHMLPGGIKSTRFELFFEANNFTPLEEDYTQITITDEEEAKIRDLAQDPQVYDRLIASIAPSIYGHDKVKEALILQLFGGVHKERGDGVMSRGDIHMLLVGDPGAGKCLHGDSKVMLSSGEIVPIRSIADGSGAEQQSADLSLPSLSFTGAMGIQHSQRVWKREAETLLRIRTRTGKRLLVTEDHPLFISVDGYVAAVGARELGRGDRIATPRRIPVQGEPQVLPTFRPRLANNSRKHRYPTVVDEKLALLLGYLAGDGYVAYSKTSGWVTLTNNDEDVLASFQQLMLLLFGALTTRRASHSEKSAQEAYLTARPMVDYLAARFPELMGGSARKSVPSLILKSPDAVLAAFVRGLFECDGHVNVRKRQVEFSTISRELAETLHLALLRFGIVSLLKTKRKCAANTTAKRMVTSYDLIISGSFVQQYTSQIGFVSQRKSLRLALLQHSNHNTNIDLVPGVNYLLKRIRKELGLTQSQMGLPRPSYAHYEQNNRLPSTVALRKIVHSLAKRGMRSGELDRLAQLVDADLFWDEIVDVERIPHDGVVFDLEVAEVHNYIANGVVVHNSQLLKRIKNVAPKSRYVSGKGASGVGLTASVVKDEFLKGYSLEAGALVLCNNGLCCIDEFDKMSNDDRNTIHEALEQQTVSIAKANIQATLLARTTVLAAANPKFGRFDLFKGIASQIDLPPTLINRFDLIFPIQDIPDEQRDQLMAKFILNLHQNKDSRPAEIDNDMLKKYIAYAKKNIRPQLSDEAMREIEEFYVRLRNKESVGDEIKSIPITPRQLEGLVRLAEASARIQLRKKVSREDSQRAIGLLMHCLEKVGTDPDTHQLDIDIISTGVSTRQRSKLRVVQELIGELVEGGKKSIELAELIERGKERGLQSTDVEEAVDTLKRHGEIFEPRRGQIQKL